MTDFSITAITARLAVSDADRAIAFYARAFDAVEVSRFAYDGAIAHAELRIGDIVIDLKDADNVDRSPDDLGGTPVIMSIATTDVDALADRLSDAGATVLFPVSDSDYGLRDGRFRDPFGHHWHIHQPIDAE